MFSRTLLLGALAACVAAQSTVLTFTHVPNPVTDGEPQAITYATNDTSSPVTILLRQGSSSDLKTIQTLTTSATSGQFIWTPCASLPDGSDYALEITQNDQVNYFGPFQIQGSTAGNGTCSGLVSSSTSSAASASSTGTGLAGSNATATSSHSISSNGTLVTSGVSSGTSFPTAHNSTVTGGTLTSTPASTLHTSTTTTSGGASFLGTTSAATPTTGAAIAIANAGSPVALILGAFAAFAMA